MQLKKYSKNFKEDSANTTKAKFSHSRPHVVKLVSKPVLFYGSVYLTGRLVLIQPYYLTILPHIQYFYSG